MFQKWFRKIDINLKSKNFILLFVGSVIIYAELMINQLTNDYDGLWENSFHNAGMWELSLGRWFWQYISRLRFGTSADPYTSLITLAIMVIGLLVLFDLWQITNKYIIILSGLLFISHSAICFELSYRYMSPTFGVAFFLSVLAVWCFEKIHNPAASILAGAFCVAFSMGSYQAYISCTTIALLTALLIKLSENREWKDIFLFLGKSAAGIVLGGAGYIVILNQYLNKYNIEMSSYQGGDNYSIWNSIQCFPASIQKIYQLFILSFKGVLFKINRLQGKQIFTLMFIFVLVISIFHFIKIFRCNKLKAILFILLIFLYPVASMSVLMIATEAALGLQTACGSALFLAALPCLFYDRKTSLNEEDAKCSDYKKVEIIIEKGRGVFSRIFALFMAVVLYGSIWQVVIDQNVMYEGRIATESLAGLVIDELLQEDMLSSDYRYVFIGTPTSSPLYAIDQNYEYSNIYALFGAWYLGSNSAKSWRGVIRYLKGINIEMVTGAEYEILSSSETVKNMSQFPEEGSVLLENDIVYVKIGAAN